MAWTKNQQIAAVIAARLAGWPDERRYIAMHHVGCPLDPRTKRPSVHHPHNDHRAFERLMALAESCALSRGEGDNFPRPQSGGFWRDAAASTTDRVVRLIKQIEAEALERCPEKFAPGFMAAFILRQCGRDQFLQHGIDMPGTLADLDDGQAYRVLEGLKHWVGHYMHGRGMLPKSFAWHPRREIRRDGEEMAA